MRKTTSLLLAGIAASLTLSGAAIAQPAPDGDSPHVERQRGRQMNMPTTRAEAEARASQAFERMDVNGDGQLNAADRDARGGMMFDRLDANSDGVLSRDEFRSAGEDRRQGAAGRREGHAEMRGPGSGSMGGMGGPLLFGRNLADADGNSDGSISASEFSAAALARFDKADSNGDGTISAEERREARSERPGMRMRGPMPPAPPAPPAE